MTKVGWRKGLFVFALLCFLGGPTFAATAPQQSGILVWRVKEDRVDAQIDGWPLQTLLEKISAKTRWQIMVEPKLQHTVSAKFKDLKPGEALHRLLGNLNFVLVPATGSSAKLFIFQTSVQTATELVVAPAEHSDKPKSSHEIVNELVVRLKSGSPEELAARLGGIIVGRADDLHAYRLRFKDAEAARIARETLARDDNVAALDSNFFVDPPDLPETLMLGGTPSFNLKPRPAGDGGQVVIALIDTAVQTDGTTLKDFLLPGISVAGPSSAPSDALTHGTTMGETILNALSKAPGSEAGTPVRLLPIDVYGSNESATTFDIAQGIYAAVNSGAQIINLSLGGDGDSPFMQSVIKSAHDRGVIFVGAAGNEPVATPTYPAAYPEVIAVTATTRNGQIATYANRGDFVDVAAPGVSLVPFQGQPYVVVGTSTATANVSALASTLLANGSSPAAVEAQIRQNLAVTLPPAP